MEKENNNIWNKAFAVLVVYLMLGSLISAESIAQENKDDFSKKSPLDQGDYSNPTAYPSIFSNPLFDSAFVPVERIATIPVQIVDVTRVKDKSKLTSGQLKESNNLEKVGDLSILNAAHLSTALTQKHGLPNIEITVIKGITYKNGKLINPNFPEGLDLDSIKKNPKVVAITAIDDKSKPNYNGFVVLEIDGDHKVVTSTNIGVINGFEFDENGDLIVKGTNGNFILKQGQIDGIKDEQGNSIYLAKQGAVVKYKGMEFTAQGSKGTKFNFDDKGSIAVIGAATFKGTILNHKIDGKNFQDELNIKFDETLKDFFISAKAAEVSIGEDKYSGSFSANYRNSNLMDFSLNNRGSSATIRGHLRISNDDSTPKRFVTQHSDLGKKFLPLLQESDTAKLSLETKKLWAELPNTGYIEFDANDKALAADTIPKRYVVLPGASSYGSRQDIMSFAGLKDGVYSIYVPAAHAEESGINGIEKRGKIYFQAGKLDVIGDLGIARAKTIIGLIETKIGIDTNGNIYTKLSRDSAIKNNIADAGLVIIGPPSKDAGTSMLILDEEGIHAIDKLITHASTNQNGEVLTNPEAIRRLTENFKKIGDAALELITSEKPAKDKAAELEEQVDKAKLILAQDKNNEVARRFLVAAASQYAENKQYAKAEELLKGLGQLDNDEKLALAYVLSAQDNARKRAEATEIYTKLIQDGTLTKQQSLLLAQTQLQSRDIEGVKGTLADLYAKRQLNTEQKNLYADLLQQSGNNEQARKVYSEIAADYEKKGDTRKAAQAYLKANDNSNALRFAERLEKGNLDDKAAAAHIYELNGQKDKSYTLFKETADKGVVDSQFALAQRFDATTALSPEGIQNSRRHWEAIAGNAQAAPEIREYARQKLREKDELLRVSQIVNQYKSNEDGYLRQFDQEAKKVEDIAYVPNWLDGSTSKLDALEGNWQSQSAANRRSAIRQLESALSSGLSDTSRVEVLKNLRTLYQQDKQTDKAISVINQEINRIEQKIASEPDPIKKAELQKSVSELKGANYEAHKVKVAEASQSFREASENYGLVNYALQILTSDDEKYDNTKTALEKSNKDMLQSQASYLSGLSADEIRREEQRLRQERTYKILSSAPKPEELVALQSQLESAQRQQAATLKHQQLLLSENPELRQNPQLLQTLTEARVSNQLVEEDVRENIRRSEQLKKDIEFHRNLPFTALGSGVVDKLENVPVFGGLVGMAASTVEWTASKVGLDVELTGKDQYMQSQILRLSELNRQKLEEAKENERRLIQDFRNDEILKRSTLTDSQRELLQKELINARITNAELELEYKTQKYEDLTENLREGGAGFYGRTSAGEWWNYATGKTEDAIKTYERETTRLYEDAKAGKEVLRQAEQGKSLAQIYAENPQLSQRVKGKLDNFNYDYDSTIEKTEVFERNIYDEIFNPETTLSFIVTAPAFSAVGQSTLGAISRLTQATTKGLQ
ncbi:MAG: hypothetical protein HY361_05410, partial [Candidatus Aenigmarchaeota archaeon]|nr:hypothetical protein [Candidatus Aenigmarchaeota archaeon]